MLKKLLITSLILGGLPMAVFAEESESSVTETTESAVTLNIETPETIDQAFFKNVLADFFKKTLEIEQSDTHMTTQSWINLEKDVMLTQLPVGPKNAEVYQYNDGSTAELASASIERLQEMSKDADDKTANSFKKLLEDVDGKYLIVDIPENKDQLSKLPDSYQQVIDQLSTFEEDKETGQLIGHSEAIPLKDSNAFNMLVETYGEKGTVTHHVIVDIKAQTMTFKHTFTADPEMTSSETDANGADTETSFIETSTAAEDDTANEGDETAEADKESSQIDNTSSEETTIADEGSGAPDSINPAKNSHLILTLKLSNKELPSKEALDTITYDELTKLAKKHNLTIFE